MVVNQSGFSNYLGHLNTFWDIGTHIEMYICETKITWKLEIILFLLFWFYKIFY